MQNSARFGHMCHNHCRSYGHKICNFNGLPDCPHVDGMRNQELHPGTETWAKVPATFIRVRNSEDSIAMVMMVSTSRQNISREFHANICSIKLAILTEPASQCPTSLLQLNFMLPLLLSAGGFLCDSCQTLIEAIISLYANFTVEPFFICQKNSTLSFG